MALQHLRASTADKRPTPAAMADGQLAMNTNLASPGLFFKDSNGDLVKTGPVHVGTTAPNATPASGGQAGNSKGELWLDTTGSDYTLKTWDGSAWREIVVTSTMIKDGTIVNADINASAAIAGTKVAPDFGSQNVTTTGTATAASLNPTGSSVPTNGVYLPAANSVAISTNGTGRLFVNSTGLVGLGTSSPEETLDVLGNIRSYGSSFTGKFQLNKPADFAGLIVSHGTYLDNTTKGGVLLRGGHGDSGSLNAWAIYARRGSTGGALAAATLTFAHVTQNTGAETPRMTINQSGNVGIGTTSPATTLDVNGDVTITDKIIHGGDTNTAIRFPAADTVSVETNGSERARIDSSGRLLVGTSTARTVFGTTSAKVLVESVSDTDRYVQFAANTNSVGGFGLYLLKSRGTTNGSNTVVQSGDNLGFITFQGTDGTNRINAAEIIAEVDGTPGANDMPGRLVFSTTADGASSPTERMRITNAGNVYIGTTSDTYPNPGIALFSSGASQFGNNAGAAGFGFLAFSRSNVLIGSITQNGTTGVAYNTTSDYRLKENVIPLTGAIDRINQLEVRQFNFIAEPERTVDGFIAHEAQAVVPEAVTGTKDEVDDDGNPVYQGIDQSKLVPLLTAALQEAIGRIETLEAEVTALKAQ